ncbi:hypothetical protein RGG57_000873 [Acinetobacter baumannii]|uniref:hypothetical protein n=1 Tax=Acinetobacter calcoaceticus/baumannii complex TaxID=909768 RepID=UPI0009E13C0A|nr:MULTISPECIES: hypothetical protein [Acinetobacter calcoaceticus/baumannii complex]ARG16333.1 hypothetical protein B7L44_06840 [Acinetobacter nosocomialis]ELA7039043.1 hypothetical protein [Acinetobacter baumannii]MCZ6923875.1 hypothetical protein [Acinetobacter baumannii]MDN8336192.1 hypothetical protein [Acinetobacter baumannii]MEB3855794.1 hypothetical protein [Acinetobacter nosocomialis]
MERIIRAIKSWWNGEWETWSDPDSFGIGLNRHWTSKFAHWVVDLFFNPEYRARLLWLTGIITFLFFITDRLPKIHTNQQPTNIEKNSTDPKIQIDGAKK